MQPYAVIRQKLERQETICLDGAMGAELVRRGVRWRDHGLRTNAAAVAELHAEYLAAGVDVLRTNTFQLNRRIYQDVFRDAAHMRQIGAPSLDHRVTELVPLAVRLAQSAREGAGRAAVAIAGVMSPLEHCFRPDLAPAAELAQAEHAEIAELLANAGVDLLLESMNTLGEACAALEAARATRLPTWVSFVVGADGNVLSGESLAEAARRVEALGADAVLANCAPPEDVDRAVAILAANVGTPFGAYAHIGRFDPPSWKFEYFPQFNELETWPPARYAAATTAWRSHGARILGGCCGTSPDHVRAYESMLRESVS